MALSREDLPPAPFPADIPGTSTLPRPFGTHRYLEGVGIPSLPQELHWEKSSHTAQLWSCIFISGSGSDPVRVRNAGVASTEESPTFPKPPAFRDFCPLDSPKCSVLILPLQQLKHQRTWSPSLTPLCSPSIPPQFPPGFHPKFPQHTHPMAGCPLQGLTFPVICSFQRDGKIGK